MKKLSLKQIFFGLFIVTIFSLLLLSGTAIFFNSYLVNNQNYLIKATAIEESRATMSSTLLNFLSRQESILTATNVADITRLSNSASFSDNFLDAITLLKKIGAKNPLIMQSLLLLESSYQEFLKNDLQLYDLSKSTLMVQDQLYKLTRDINDELKILQGNAENISGVYVLRNAENSRKITTNLQNANMFASKSDMDKFKIDLSELLIGNLTDAQLISQRLDRNLALLAVLVNKTIIETNQDQINDIKNNRINLLIQLIQYELKKLNAITQSEPDVNRIVADTKFYFEKISSQVMQGQNNIFSLREDLNNKNENLQKLIRKIQKNKDTIVLQFKQLSNIAENLQASLVNKANLIKLYSHITIIVMGILILLLICSVGYFVLQAILNALNLLTDVMKKISNEKGDLSLRLEKTPYTELNQVGDAFNAMTGKLQFAHEHLQELVEIKTQELEKSKKSLEVRHAVTTALVEHLSVHEAISKIIKIMCETMQLQVGAFWEWNSSNNQLRCMYFWPVEADLFKEFKEESEKIQLAKGLGIPGRVIISKKLECIVELQKDSNFSRASFAKKAKLEAAFAFPILFGDEIIGVVEFYTQNRKILDQGFINTLNDINNQINVFTEREETQKRFDSLSRRAGMADVATSILHNIGNILNSVNVTINLLKEKYSNNSNLKNLSAVTLMIQENLDKLPYYFSEDPKGKLIPKYLIEIAKLFDNENEMLKKELHSLIDHIKHIEDIVAMQKSISGVSGMSERVFLPEIVNAAITMCDTSLEKRNITITQDFKEKNYISTDKSKLLQILVNLVQNARDALSSTEYDIPNKKILITIEKSLDNAFIRIILTDNGTGILPQNLTKIFSLGFTTKPTGHGYGLHSSATAAKELGGSLQAASKGLGQGATFTLCLPLKIDRTISDRSTINANVH